MGGRRPRFAGRHDEARGGVRGRGESSLVPPTAYFDLAYAILRHNGVDIGKMDFLGIINWTAA